MRKKILSNLWQSNTWKNFQVLAGNRSFWIKEKNAKALIIRRSPHFLKFWKPKLWEIPRGPIGNKENFSELFRKIFSEAKKENIPTVRIYPPFGEENFWEKFPEILQHFSHQVAPEIFPCHTLLLDLEQSEEEILAQMKQKGRYNIRLAKRKGIKIFREENIENFWKILEQTAKRDGFTTNRKKIYQAMIDSFKENAVILSAKDETGEVLASKIFVTDKGYQGTGENAVYYYGASSNRKRNLMAPYLLQWEGIRWAKSQGCKQYDFLGISPENEKNHQLSSVSGFKLKFGGERVISDTGIDFLV